MFADDADFFLSICAICEHLRTHRKGPPDQAGVHCARHAGRGKGGAGHAPGQPSAVSKRRDSCPLWLRSKILELPETVGVGRVEEHNGNTLDEDETEVGRQADWHEIKW